MFEEINSADDAIEALGGTTAVAKLFAQDLRVVSNWRARGLPRWTYLLFKDAFEKRSLPVPPPSLWGIAAPALDAGIPTTAADQGSE
jgi:hypothetical protein